MIRLKKHTIQEKHGVSHYLVFDSVKDFHAFTNSEVFNFSKNNKDVWNTIKQTAIKRINSNSNWYGSPIPKSVKELEKHTDFLGMHLIENVRNKLKDKLDLFLEKVSQNQLPISQLSYNDKGLGVFSFDRAAMGLAKDYKIDISTQIDSKISKMRVELDKTVYKTSVRKAYASFEKKDHALPSIQLYILAGANANLKGEQILYVGLACNELVNFLEARNIPVEVNVLIGTNFSDKTLMNIIRVKRFQDSLDNNQLLLLAADPRYFRHRGFKSLISAANSFDLEIPQDLGGIKGDMGKNFVKEINSNGFVFEQSYSIDQVVNEVSQILMNYMKD